MLVKSWISAEQMVQMIPPKFQILFDSIFGLWELKSNVEGQILLSLKTVNFIKWSFICLMGSSSCYQPTFQNQI